MVVGILGVALLSAGCVRGTATQVAGVTATVGPSAAATMTLSPVPGTEPPTLTATPHGPPTATNTRVVTATWTYPAQLWTATPTLTPTATRPSTASVTADATATSTAIITQTAQDKGKKGGGRKWVPGKVFVILTRPDPEEDAEPE